MKRLDLFNAPLTRWVMIPHCMFVRQIARGGCDWSRRSEGMPLVWPNGFFGNWANGFLMDGDLI